MLAAQCHFSYVYVLGYGKHGVWGQEYHWYGVTCLISEDISGRPLRLMLLHV